MWLLPYLATHILPCPLLTASSGSSLELGVSTLRYFCATVFSNSPQVDFFRNVVDDPPLACFLSHIHSDHIAGLDTFKGRLVYCSAATRAMLLKLQRKASRINFAQGVLEAEEITYKHQKNRLVRLPYLSAAHDQQLMSNRKLCHWIPRRMSNLPQTPPCG